MRIEDLYDLYLQHPVVTTDSRQTPAGSMFFALRGASFDGNRYAAAALEKGCAVAVVDDPQVAAEGDSRYAVVDNVEQTLQALAAYHRAQLHIPVVQITGTNGKTTTKELVTAVLSEKFRTLATEGNLNNHLGVPRTLLRIRPEHEIAVVETGANHPGEIAFLCRMVKASCGLITNVGRAHLEGFGSFEGVKRTKGELYDDLARRGGFIFLNAMDENLVEMAARRELRTVPYAQGVVVECTPFVRIKWMAPDGTAHDVQTRLIGAYNLPNMLAAITVGLHFGVSPDAIDHALSHYTPTNSRSELRETGRNRLIVDAYNANPTSMGAALDSFALVRAPRKMVILGDMRELGEASADEHQRVVRRVSEIAPSEAWFVGTNWPALPPAYRHFADVAAVKAALREATPEGYTILVKGSNGTHLYELPPLL